MFKFFKHYLGNERGILGIDDALLAVLLPTLTGAIGSATSKSKKSTVSQESMLTDEQKNALTQLLSSAGQQYSGALGSYSMTPTEQAGMGSLNTLLASSIPKMSQLGQTEIEKLLTSGAYDPYAKGGQYQGLKTNILREAKDVEGVLNRQGAITGGLYSSGIAKEKGLLAERTHQTLANTLADLYQNYTNQKLTGAQTAQNMGVQNEQVEQSRISQAMQYGSLQRTLEDAQAKAQYSNWLTARGEKLNALTNVMNMNANYGVKSYTATSENPWTSLLNTALTGVGTYLGQKSLNKTNNSGYTNWM